MSKIWRLLALGLVGLMLTAPARAVVVSGTWNFTATDIVSGTGTYTGSFSFTGFDSIIPYANSTAAGFTVTTSFTTLGTNVFTYNVLNDTLTIGGGSNALSWSTSNTNDWQLVVDNFLQSQFVRLRYSAAGAINGTDIDTRVGSVTKVVPEPGTLALLGLGIVGLGLSRRRKSH